MGGRGPWWAFYCHTRGQNGTLIHTLTGVSVQSRGPWHRQKMWFKHPQGQHSSHGQQTQSVLSRNVLVREWPHTLDSTGILAMFPASPVLDLPVVVNPTQLLVRLSQAQWPPPSPVPWSGRPLCFEPLFQWHLCQGFQVPETPQVPLLLGNARACLL